MTKQAQNLSITITTIAAFKKRVNTLFADREEWQTTMFATANQRLYQLLADIYTVYLEAKDGNDIATAKYEWLLSFGRR